LAEQHVARARGRYGAGRVLRDLSSKGVAADVLEQSAAVLRRSELEQARAAWRKRFGEPATNAKERARQWRFLRGRGFSAEAIHQVVGGEWEDE
jgi:regulatory protein